MRTAPRKPRSILLIEDNRDAADSLALVLQLLGYDVAVAYSGPDGVRRARERPPDVVISDLGLPGLDGFGVARALRRDPATTRARLIAVSAYGPDVYGPRVAEAGFERHFTKPADPLALHALLAAA